MRPCHQPAPPNRPGRPRRRPGPALRRHPRRPHPAAHHRTSTRLYSNRPEHKSLQPDCAPAGKNAAGQLQRRPIRSGPPISALIGKEGNRLLERATGEITDSAAYRTTYTPGTDRWQTLVLPALHHIRDTRGTANWRQS